MSGLDPAGGAHDEAGTEPSVEGSEAQNGELQPGADEADPAAARRHAKRLDDHNEPD